MTDMEKTTMAQATDDGDLVDRVFDYLVILRPELKSDTQGLAEMKRAVRHEFGEDRSYVRGRDTGSRLAMQVLNLFNGRNATEVARVLGISRATVYRVLKQPGVSAAEKSSITT